MLGLERGTFYNVAKTKWMAVGNSSNGNGMMNGEQVEPIEEFCYLCSILTNNGNCCKDIRTRIAKANLAFSRLNNIWRDRKLGLPIKIRLYTSIVKAILFYSAETWPLTKTETQRPEGRGCTPQVAENDSKRLMERYGSQRKYSGAN